MSAEWDGKAEHRVDASVLVIKGLIRVTFVVKPLKVNNGLNIKVILRA